MYKSYKKNETKSTNGRSEEVSSAGKPQADSIKQVAAGIDH